MPKGEMVGVVLASMILAACVVVIPSVAAGLPADWTSIAAGAILVAVVAGAIAAALCLVTKRRGAPAS